MKFKLFYALFLVIGFVQSSNGQINGPTSGTIGESLYFEYDDDAVHPANNWTGVTDGTLNSKGVIDGTLYHGYITFSSYGTKTVSFKNAGTVIATITVTISCYTAAPSTTISITNNCGNAVISYSGGTPPGGVTWYWQSSSSSFDTSLGSGTSLTVYNSATYYLAAYNGTCWSASAMSVGTTSVLAVPSVTTSDQTITSGATTSIPLNSSISGTTYSWTVSQSNAAWAFNSSGSGIAQTISATTSGDGTVTYSITGTAPDGCTGTATSVVTVRRQITGDTSGNPNANLYFYYDDGDNHSDNWTATGGTLISKSHTGTTYTGIINFSSTGTQTVTFLDGGITMVTVSANVWCTVPSTPGPSINVTNYCGYTVITRSGSTPPGGVNWYWQSSSSSFNTSLGNASSLTLTSPGTYYLAAYGTGCWSTSAQNAGTITINAVPSVPDPSIGVTNNCGNTVITRSGSTPPGGVDWYWQSSSSSFTTTLGNSSSLTLTTPGTYYLAAIAATGGCWSTAAESAGGAITVYQVPAVPSPTITITNNCGNTVISRSGSTPPGGADWYWQSSSSSFNTSLGNSSSLTLTSPGTFYLAAVATTGGSCWSTSAQSAGSVTVNAVPVVTTSNQTICSGTASSVSLSSTVTGTTFGWTASPTNVSGSSNSSGSNIAQTLTTSSASDGSVAYSITGTTPAGCTGTASSTVSVKYTASGSLNTSLQEIYGPADPNLNISSYQSGAALLWQKSSDGTSWSSGSEPNTNTTYHESRTSTIQYRVQVTNGSCAVYTPVSSLIISQPPVISCAMNPAFIPLGGSPLTLNVNSNNGVSYHSYQWFKSGTPVSTASSYVAAEPASYTLQVTSSATSSTATTSFNVYETGLQPSNTDNTIVTTTIRKAGVTTTTDLYTTLTPVDYTQSIQYLDGMSRPLQTVLIGQSPLQKDVVQPYSYDSLRPTSYLPYVASTREGTRRTTALVNGSYSGSDQYLFYQQTNAKIANSTAPFAKTVYENSPLGRVLEQGAPGTDWQPGTSTPGAHTVKPVFHTNNSSFPVRTWSTTGPTGSYYSANTLTAGMVTDENGNPVITYTDKLGQTILKRVKTSSSPDSTTWLETYYVYDIRGNLLMQVPPKASALYNAGTTWNSTFRDLWCFQYIYDNRSRLIEKKVPGAASVYYIYDPLGRLVLTQDGRLRASSQWAFVKYDMQGRAAMSGLYKNTSQTTRTDVQTLADTLYSNPAHPWYEDRGTTLHGYTNQSFPRVNADASALSVLSVNYFDDYDFDSNGSPDYYYQSQGMTGESRQSNSFGLATGSKRLVLGSSTWLYSYIFYDRFGRVIQSRSNNHLSSAKDNLSTIVYDFEGKVLQTKTYHNPGGSGQVTVVQRSDYDQAGRLLRVYHSTNGLQEVVNASYNYNELGQVVEKNLHCTDCSDPGVTQPNTAYSATLSRTGYTATEKNLLATQSITLGPGYLVNAASGNTLHARILGSTLATIPGGGGTFMQSVDYRYNIRGWLSSINNAQLTNDGGINDDSNDYFGMELFYNNAEGSSLGNTTTYNGNLSTVKWKNAGTDSGLADQRSYKFTYDKSDRLLTAGFQANTGSAWTKESGTLNESMRYDANGNILGLLRTQNQRGLSGLTVTSSVQTIDSLTYTYASGNQMSKVEDSSADVLGFNNAVTATTEYTYDVTGSMTADQNKGISNIAYNVLGKPDSVIFSDGRKIRYTYDAAGSKLRMVAIVNDTTTTTDYVGGFVYTNTALSFFSSPEGRVAKNGGNFEYQYVIADHQGNTRVLFTSEQSDSLVYLATFEEDRETIETDTTYLRNYPASGERSALNLYDHTDAGTTYTNSYLLNGGYNSQVGIAKSFKVYPGDIVKIQAYAKYSGGSETASNLTGFASALMAAYGISPPGGGETGTVSSALNHWGGVVGTGGDDESDDAPHGAVNIVIFDKKFNWLGGNFSQVSTAAEQVGASPVVTPDFLNAEYTVTEEGYAFLYISNENETQVDVYFDDVRIVYIPGNILQSNEYYPFGMQTANSWTRSSATKNNFLANGGTELNATSQLYDLDYRNYDPILGRMNQVDPMADKYSRHTPYNYAFNSPSNQNDVNGADPHLGDWETYNRPTALDGRGGGGIRRGIPDPDHPFTGWMEASGNMFGDNPKMPHYTSLMEFLINVDPTVGGSWSASGEPTYYSNGGQQSLGTKWNPVGGRPLTREEWIARGNDPSELEADKNYQFFAGVWEQTQGGVVLDVNGNVMSWETGNNIYVNVDGTNVPFHDRLVRKGTMTSEGFSNGLMSIVQGINSSKFKFDTSKLYNGKFSVAILGADNKTVFSFNGGIYTGLQAGFVRMPDGSYKISYYHINSGSGGLTVDLIRATLGVHEYYGHGDLNLDNSKESHSIIETLVNEYLANPNR